MFLPAITTTQGSDWQAKVKEIDKLGLKQAALFLTCLDRPQQRKKLYSLLEKTKLKKIPFVHLRSDMLLSELDYLVEKWGTRVFNLHKSKEYAFKYDYVKYSQDKAPICIENTGFMLDEQEVKKMAGICLDLSHLEDDRLLRPDIYKQTISLLKKYPVGCNHISAVQKQSHPDEQGKHWHSMHYLDDLAELDYLKKYPKSYFSNYIAIELENTLAEQLKIIDHLLIIL